ncbi:MAG TPA: hypothetical protein VFY43_09450, partial [Candidatus Limnocylindria bacterium]|nr:hypothetical protein [Candidatus Limnocylindria bacterium]
MSALPRPMSLDREPPDLGQLELAELVALASGAEVAVCREMLEADPWLVRLESTGPEALALAH